MENLEPDYTVMARPCLICPATIRGVIANDGLEPAHFYHGDLLLGDVALDQETFERDVLSIVAGAHAIDV